MTNDCRLGSSTVNGWYFQGGAARVNHYGIDSDVVIRLVGALVLGAAVGAERELAGHTAGLRTHIAVCVGAALFGVISTLGFSEFQNIQTNTYRADITRVASQVVLGGADGTRG